MHCQLQFTIRLLASEPAKSLERCEGINFRLGRLRNGGNPFSMKKQKNKKTK
jgi:hypothetical protein